MLFAGSRQARGSVLSEVSGIHQAGQAGNGAVCIGGLSVDEGGDSNDGSDKVADLCDVLQLGDQSVDVSIRCMARASSVVMRRNGKDPYHSASGFAALSVAGGTPPGLRPNGLEKVRGCVLKFRARNLACPRRHREVECTVSGKKVRPESFPLFPVTRLFTVKSPPGLGKSAHRFRAWLTFLEIGKLAARRVGLRPDSGAHCSHCGNISSRCWRRSIFR